MFIGHFGIGFGAKKYAPAISLGVLFIAAQFLDLLWPSLLLLDLEHVVISPGITKVMPYDFIDYPISHSLIMVVGWGFILALLAKFMFKNLKYSIIIFLCVISHWFLDLIVHRPDLPIIPGDSTLLGFGLWNYPFLTALIEGVIFIAGVFLYLKATSSKNNHGKYGLIVLIVLFIVIQVGSMLGPPPPSVNAIAWVGQSQWLFVILAFYVDKNRIATNYRLNSTRNTRH